MVSKEILRLNHLSISYPDSTNALSDINLSINEDDFVVVMGKTEAGKSTLGLVIAGLIPRVIKANVTGEIRIYDNNTQKNPIPVGIVLQDFESQLFSTNVLMEIAFVQENLMIPVEEIKKRCKEILNLLKIEHLATRNILSLSGGEKQIVAIASIIAGNFKIFVLDEPTTDLDPLGKSMVYDVFGRIPNTKIIIDNDAEKALKADRIIVLKDGKLIASEIPEKILTRNQFLEDNGIRPIDTNRIFPGILTVEDALSFIKENKITINQIDFNKKTVKKGEPIIECSSLTFGYKKGSPVLKDIDLRINQGDFLAIIGQNGSGKTTLAKLLCRLLIPQNGNIRIKSKDIRDYTRRELASIIGYVFQNPDHQIFCNTVKEEIAFALKNFGRDEDTIENITKEVLNLCDLRGYEDKDPFSLTKGEKQRLAVATVLAFKPEIIILDEPTTGLDYQQQKEIMNLLKELNKNGYTIIIITHTMWLVAEYTDRTLVMADGRIVLDKKTREVFIDEDELMKYHLEPPQVCRLGNRLGLSILTIDEFRKCISM
ncbi:MAG: energy-coupling factor transporter ATPase [candidate division WOR-3 bacterium]|nr:energy-coupling factor transporter ATPase [candidate division WOR-3 bacterium]